MSRCSTQYAALRPTRRQHAGAAVHAAVERGEPPLTLPPLHAVTKDNLWLSPPHITQPRPQLRPRLRTSVGDMRCLPLYLCAAVHAAAAQHGNRQQAEPLHEPLARAVRAHIMEYGEVHTIDDAYDELGVMSTFYPDKWAELLAADASSKLDAAAAEMAQGDAWLCWPDGALPRARALSACGSPEDTPSLSPSLSLLQA